MIVELANRQSIDVFRHTTVAGILSNRARSSRFGVQQAVVRQSAQTNGHGGAYFLPRVAGIQPDRPQSGRGPDASLEFVVPTILALGLAVTLVCLSTWFHGRVIAALSAWSGALDQRHQHLLFLVVTGLIGAHCLEILAYAAGFSLGAGPFGLGTFAGARDFAAPDMVYFAAETFSTLGYGDIYPVGALRLIAGICSLNGILLMAWSGSLLYAIAQKVHQSSPNDRSDDGR